MSRMLEVICTALDLDEPRAFFAKEKVEYVVRCKDCKRTEDKPGLHGELWCWYHEQRVEPDGFCAWGERRDG